MPSETDPLDYDNMEAGETVRLRSYNRGTRYDFHGDGESASTASVGHEPTNFTIEVDDNGWTIVTMETASRQFVWDEGDGDHFSELINGWDVHVGVQDSDRNSTAAPSASPTASPSSVPRRRP